MNKTVLQSLLVLAAGSCLGGVPTLYDTFDSGYPSGLTFTTPTNGWQASSAAACVTNQAVFMDGNVALSNAVNADAGLVVWTDVRLKPMFGEALDAPPTNTAAFHAYFSSNGYLVVATPSGWWTCTNDIWGGRVAPVTSDYARLSVFQDYSRSNEAVLLNDRLVIQDLRFVGSAASYHRLAFQNTDSNCWLDSVWVRTNAGPDALASDRNGDGLADAQELQVYGYACRTQYVAGSGYPSYATLQAAVAAWRPRDTVYVPAGTYAESLAVSDAVVFAGGTFTNTGSLTLQTPSSPAFRAGMTWGAVVIDSNAVATLVQPLACASLAVLPGARLTCQGTLACANLATFASGSTSVFMEAVSCPGTVSVASAAAVAFDGGGTVGTLACTGSVSVATGQSLAASAVAGQGAIAVASGATVSVATTLGLSAGGHLDFTQARFVFSPLSADMSGTFSLGAGWGQGNAVTVSPGGSVTFNQGLTNPVLSSLTLSAGSTSSLQAVTCTNLTAEDSTRVAVLGALQCTASATLGQGVVAGFSNTVACADTLTVGTNATATFSQAVLCSNLIVRSGATVVMQALTCSNLVVEAGAHFTCAGPFVCAGSSSFVAGAVAGFQGAVSCAGSFSVAAGASVSLAQGGSLGALVLDGTLTAGAGQTVAVTAATVSGGFQVAGGGTLSVGASLSISGNGVLTFAGSHLSVPASRVDMTGTFTVSNTWGTAATMALPFSDDFEAYGSGTPLASLGFRGWGASNDQVTVQSAVRNGGTQAVIVPSGTALSNRVASASATHVWSDFQIRPMLGEPPDASVTTGRSFAAYVNADGFLVVAASNGWTVCSNRLDHSAPTPMRTNAFTRVTVFQDLVRGTLAVFVGGDLVAQGLGAPVSRPSVASLAIHNVDSEAYLDDVSMSTAIPAGLSSDGDDDGIPDAYEINAFGSTFVQPLGSIFKWR